jgi:FecR protein
MLSCDFRKLLAVALISTTTLITMPISAADLPSTKPVLGSVGVVGSVELRGVGISLEGTLFSGDSIRSHEKGYAKVLLEDRSKIELYEKTDVSVNRDKEGVKIAMTTGNLGFTAKSTLRVDVVPYEITATDASGNVAIFGSTTADVRALNGKVMVRNLKTQESFVLMKGQEQWLGLQNGVHAKPLGQIASNVPTIPPPGAPAPQTTPSGKTGGPGLAMDKGAWLAVAAVTGVGVAAIWGWVEVNNRNNDIDSLNSQIKNLKNASAVQANIAAQQVALSQVVSQSQAALSALQAAGQGNSPAAAQLQAIIASANTQLQALSGLSASTSFNASILNTTNSIINTFNSQCPTCGHVGTIGSPPVTSASVPT